MQYIEHDKMCKQTWQSQMQLAQSRFRKVHTARLPKFLLRKSLFILVTSYDGIALIQFHGFHTN